jgi:pilus assembly protein Flp/PilA
MRRSARQLSRFIRDDGGATAIEYALIACGVSIAIVSSVTSLGNNMMTLFYDKLQNLF